MSNIGGNGVQRRARHATARIVTAAAVLASSVAVTILPGADHAFAASITVTTTADVIDAAANCANVLVASLPGTDGQTSLREAVCAANNNGGADTINFAVNGTFALIGSANEDGGNSGDLDVQGSLTINGNGAANTILDGTGNDRIFDVFPPAATAFNLSGLTVQHGDTRVASFKEGGAMYLHNNVTTTLASVAIKDNFSGVNGAIANRGTLTITNSLISGNQTIPASGGTMGGGLYNSGPLTITGSTFSNNTVRGEGGALANGGGADVSISNTTFSGNSASVAGGGVGNGGAISTTVSQSLISLTNVTISGNRADNSGGGVHAAASGTGGVSLTQTTITANTADFDNTGGGSGGGLFQLNQSVSLGGTIVAGNFRGSPAIKDDISGRVAPSSPSNLVGDGTGLVGIANGGTNQVGTAGSPIDPLVGPLADNGGPNLTHALLAGSPAINGVTGGCPAADQRGNPRVGACDIGSYEFVPAPPDTAITANPTNPTNNSTASFSFTSTGGTGAITFACRLDGGAFSPCTSPQNYTGLSDGSHTFMVRAVDSLGNDDPSPAAYTWVVDATAPTTTITAQPTNPTSSSNASFSFTGNDAGGTGVASYGCQLDGGGFLACASPQSYLGLADGSHTFQVRAIDASGNSDPTPASYTWVVDTTAPDTILTGQPATLTTDTNANFSFIGTDTGGSGIDSFSCRLDAGAFVSCSIAPTYSGLTDGSHTFQARATDLAGNVDPTPLSYTWFIDTVGPDTTIATQPAVLTGDPDATFVFSGSDTGGSGVIGYECQLDSGAFASCSSPLTYFGLADGPHTFGVRAIDLAGHVDATPATHDWVIDATAPETTIASGPVTPTSSAAATLVFSGTDSGGSGVASYECQLDGGGYSACTSPQTYASLADGPHTFEVRATDAAGNVDATPASYVWVIDTVVPDTVIELGPPATTTDTTATFTFGRSVTATSLQAQGAGPTFECSLDADAFAPCTSPVTLTSLAIGAHTFRVRATSPSGLVDPTPAQATWSVIAPPTTTTTPATTVPSTTTPTTTPVTTPATPPTPTIDPNTVLPATGSDPSRVLVLAMGLLLVGLVLVTRSRRTARQG